MCYVQCKDHQIEALKTYKEENLRKGKLYPAPRSKQLSVQIKEEDWDWAPLSHHQLKMNLQAN